MINMTARNFDLTEGIKGYVSKRLDKISKYLDDNQKVDVVMEANDYGQEIEVSLLYNGYNVRASSIDEDLYTATDLVSDKVEKQLRRISDKLTSKRNKPSKEQIEVESINSIEDELEKEKQSSRIVKRKVISAKPMFEEEAIEQMDLLDHRSFIFFNATTNTICMLYKRHDGDYGIIEAI